MPVVQDKVNSMVALRKPGRPPKDVKLTESMPIKITPEMRAAITRIQIEEGFSVIQDAARKLLLEALQARGVVKT